VTCCAGHPTGQRDDNRRGDRRHSPSFIMMLSLVFPPKRPSPVIQWLAFAQHLPGARAGHGALHLGGVVLAALVREWAVCLNPKEAVHRLTAHAGENPSAIGSRADPDRRTGRPSRGMLSKISSASADDVRAESACATGMRMSRVNGVATLSNGALTGARAGQGRANG